MSHPTEPWRFVYDAENGNGHIEGADGRYVEHGYESEENWRRIVACVNFCAGIPTETLLACINQHDPISQKSLTERMP